MIVALVLLVAALAIGGVLAALALRDPGYVLLSYAGATLETSVWFAVVVLLALWLVIAVAYRIVRRSLHSGPALAEWLRGRRAVRASNRSLRGWMLLAEHRWQDAAKALLAAAGQVSTPMVNYIGAARAASAQGRDDDRDAALQLAREAQPEAAFIVDLIRSELQQEAGQWQPSLTTLADLQRQAPRHPVVLARLYAAHKALGDWEAVAKLAPSLGDDAPDDVAEIQAAAWRTRLAKAREGPNAAENVRSAWQAMPRKLHADETILLAYVDALADDGAGEEAETVLRQGLKSHWRDAWVRRYGTIRGDAEKQLQTTLDWRKNHPEDAGLLLTMGRLAMAGGDNAKAREHLQASLDAAADVDVLETLGQLCAASGDPVAANDYFQQALALVALGNRTD